MGRPALDIIATVVRLTRDSVVEIDRIAGKNKRAQFIRDAVERELSRRSRKTAKKETGDNGKV